MVAFCSPALPHAPGGQGACARSPLLIPAFPPNTGLHPTALRTIPDLPARLMQIRAWQQPGDSTERDRKTAPSPPSGGGAWRITTADLCVPGRCHRAKRDKESSNAD